MVESKGDRLQLQHVYMQGRPAVRLGSAEFLCLPRLPPNPSWRRLSSSLRGSTPLPCSHPRAGERLSSTSVGMQVERIEPRLGACRVDPAEWPIWLRPSVTTVFGTTSEWPAIPVKTGRVDLG
ncbi:UNVERIFIED_CONTAM: hypothetical protein FKN15_042398 [Acipenser sinensis]